MCVCMVEWTVGKGGGCCCGVVLAGLVVFDDGD